jgi:hypothetical protein
MARHSEDGETLDAMMIELLAVVVYDSVVELMAGRFSMAARLEGD